MANPFARFVVHYLDGTTIHEDRKNPTHWDKLPNKKDIVAMGILFDPQLLYFPQAKDSNGKPLPIIDPLSKVHMKEEYAEPVLKGSKKYYYGFFQMKDKMKSFGPVRGGFRTVSGTELSLMVGRVVDCFPWLHPITGERVKDPHTGEPLNDGHCEVMYGTIARQVRSFYTTVRGLHFDDNSLRNQGIILEDCGKLREEINNKKPPIDVIGEENET